MWTTALKKDTRAPHLGTQIEVAQQLKSTGAQCMRIWGSSTAVSIMLIVLNAASHNMYAKRQTYLRLPEQPGRGESHANQFIIIWCLLACYNNIARGHIIWIIWRRRDHGVTQNILRRALARLPSETTCEMFICWVCCAGAARRRDDACDRYAPNRLQELDKLPVFENTFCRRGERDVCCDFIMWSGQIGTKSRTMTEWVQ